jgi:hypothetical protein
MTLGFDKVLHLVVSFLIALFDPVLAVAAGLFKEAFDHVFGGGLDPGDLTANLAGILLAHWLG